MTSPNLWNYYDQGYALAWGSQLLDGSLPDYEAPGTSTPHPLTVLLAALSELLAPGRGFEVLTFLNVASWVAMIGAVAVVGHAAFGMPAAVAGAAVTAGLPRLFQQLGGSTADVLFVASVLVAAAYESRRPRAGAPVLAILVVAGLVRPEAWLISGVYWLYLLPSSTTATRIRRAVLAGSAPALWVLSDWIVTGQPLFSFTDTQSAAALAGRATGVTNIVPQFVDGLRSLLDRPHLIGAAAAIGMLAFHRPRPALVTAAAAGVVMLAFAALGVARLPMVSRYLLVVHVVACVMAGWSLAMWAAPGLPLRLRRPFAAVALLVALVFLSWIDYGIEQAQTVKREQEAFIDLWDDVRATVATIERDPALTRCEITSGHFRFTSLLAYGLGRSPAEITPIPGAAPRSGLLVLPSPELERQYGTPAIRPQRPLIDPRPAFREGDLVVWRGGC